MASSQYSGEWRAARDFSFRNLECKKDERLPPTWQPSDMVRYLQKTYGADCVYHVPHRDKRAAVPAQRPQPQPAAPPVKANVAGKRK